MQIFRYDSIDQYDETSYCLASCLPAASVVCSRLCVRVSSLSPRPYSPPSGQREALQLGWSLRGHMEKHRGGNWAEEQVKNEIVGERKAGVFLA